MRRLTIVIVSYNSRADLDACLRSLTEAPPEASHEIVVVDNGSTDGTPAHLRAAWPAVRLIDAGGNLGFARANNVAIRQTASVHVLLLNPDTVVAPGAIDRLLARLEHEARTAIAGPRLVDGEGRPELSWGAMLSPLSEWRHRLLVRSAARGWRVAVRAIERRTRTARRVDWVSGACLLVRRSDLEAAGLLDERYFMYEEDVDLCAAVRALGRDVVFEPSATVVHRRGRSAASAPAAARSAYHRSHLAFYRKHRPVWVPWLRLYLKLRGERPDTTS